MLKYFINLFGLLLFFVTAMVNAQISQDIIDAFRNDPYGDRLYRKRGIMDGNLVRTMYFNQAEVARWPDQPSGEWPKGSGHSYLDGWSGQRATSAWLKYMVLTYLQVNGQKEADIPI